MKIIIFGAGYVGTVTGACLAKCGHDITFIEPNQSKITEINDGKSPILEPNLEELISEGVKSGRLKAKQFLNNEILEADMAMIAVATPSSFNGTLQLDQMQSVLQTLKAHVEKRSRPLIVTIRSTIHPLALRKLYRDVQLEKCPQISLVVNPEFLRESTAVSDFFKAPFCVAGGDDVWAVEGVLSLYQGICDKCFMMTTEMACLLKYACNAFHALKIAFANEIGSICESLELNPVQLMQVFCHDHVLNCSSAYLKPGFSFGGSCLPKDLRALLSLGREIEETLPLLSSILPSNHLRFQKVLSNLLQEDHRDLAVLGMSFKKNNDDLRESPFVELIESLIGKGIKLRIFDPDIKIDRLTGSNLKAFNHRFGHLVSFLKNDLQEALEDCDGVVLCKDICKEEVLTYIKDRSIPLYDLQYNLVSSSKKQEKLCPI
jgi:GDP-mannose 6-dehydrogenase